MKKKLERQFSGKGNKDNRLKRDVKRYTKIEMEQAHAQGMHDDLPREDCPECKP